MFISRLAIFYLVTILSLIMCIVYSDYVYSIRAGFLNIRLVDGGSTLVSKS